jgi:hypothetical protein
VKKAPSHPYACGELQHYFELLTNPFFCRRCRVSATQTLEISFFLTNPIFIIAYTLCFLFVSLNAGKTLETKRSKSFQHSDFDKSNLDEPS